MSQSPESNPFAEPREGDVPFVIHVDPPGPALKLANRLERLVNFAVDSALIYFLALGSKITLVDHLKLFGIDPLDAHDPGVIERMLILLNPVACVFIYYLPLEALTGRTVGKLFTGTYVARNDGGRPTPEQIIGRTAARFIPFEPFSVLFNGESVGWHDTLSKTRVVRVR